MSDTSAYIWISVALCAAGAGLSCVAILGGGAGVILVIAAVLLWVAAIGVTLKDPWYKRLEEIHAAQHEQNERRRAELKAEADAPLEGVIVRDR